MDDIALINNLNDDCLKHIFSFLRVRERLEIEKVCKRWRSISEEGWNNVKELKINHDDSDNSMYLMLKRCGRYLKKLAIVYSSAHPHSLSMAIEFCELDQLEEIELENLNFNTQHFLDNIRPNIIEIFEKSENLVAVNLEGNFPYDMDCYLNCLKPLALRKLRLADRTGRSSINPDQFPNLEELYLYGTDIIEDDEIPRDEGSLKGLESLNIICCWDVKNFIQRIWTFTNLRELALYSRYLDVQNEDIRLIATHCPNIVEMYLRGYLTKDCFQYLGEMRSLEILQLFLFEMDTRLAYLTNVKVLIFYRCLYMASQKEGLIELIANSSNLEELLFHKTQRVGRPFFNDVEQIFQLGQRTKTLKVIIKGRNYKCLNGVTEVTDYPLLKLRVQNDLDESEESDGDYDENW